MDHDIFYETSNISINFPHVFFGFLPHLVLQGGPKCVRARGLQMRQLLQGLLDFMQGTGRLQLGDFVG